jgi:hypothetical protein
VALSEQLEAARQRQQIQEWQANEQKLAESLGPIAKPELTQDVRDRLAVFIAYCKSNNVRHCPARPQTCAAFTKAEAANGRDPQGIVSLLAAVDDLHQHHGLASPTHTQVVRATLDNIIKVDPPRSWPAAEKAEFARLPPTIREIIAKRENNRDRELRRKRSEFAELKRHALAAESALSEGNIENVTTS